MTGNPPAMRRRYHSSASRRSLGGTAEPLSRCKEGSRAMVSNRPATASASSRTNGLSDSRSSCGVAGVGCTHKCGVVCVDTVRLVMLARASTDAQASMRLPPSDSDASLAKFP